MNRKRPPATGEETIYEIMRIGEAQRCAAIDVATGVEVVIQAPASAARADVQALAKRKLERALARAEAERQAAPKRGKRLY